MPMCDNERYISVITPVYNRQDCIVRCAESVAAQIIPEGWTMEHIIVDDGSTDETYAKIEDYASSHGHIVTGRLARNRGTNAARNEAISKARGRWLIFLDSDDEMLPGALRTVCEHIDSDKETRHFLFTPDDRTHELNNMGEEKKLSFSDFLLEKVKGDFVHVFLRETALKFPFIEELIVHEGIFFLKYYEDADNIRFANKVLFHRDRKRTDHVTRRLRLTNDEALANKTRAQELQLLWFRHEYEKHPEGIPIINTLLKSLYRLNVLGGHYHRAGELEQQLRLNHSNTSALFRTVARFRLGNTAWNAVRAFVTLKYFFK